MSELGRRLSRRGMLGTMAGAAAVGAPGPARASMVQPDPTRCAGEARYALGIIYKDEHNAIRTSQVSAGGSLEYARDLSARIAREGVRLPDPEQYIPAHRVQRVVLLTAQPMP